MPTLDDCYQQLFAECTLTASDARALDDDGFIVIHGLLPTGRLADLIDGYDRAVREASGSDVAVGRTTTRVHDLVNRGVEFDELYVHRPLLAACCHAIQQPFRLSSLLARTLHPRAAGQGLHVDVTHTDRGRPMIGFIYMIDEFRAENGATRFVPGSHRSPEDAKIGDYGDSDTVAACGPPGSVVVYNGWVRHGHGSNETERPRRSIQGVYIPRTETPATDWSARMRPETLERIGPVARYVLGIDQPARPTTA